MPKWLPDGSSRSAKTRPSLVVVGGTRTFPPAASARATESATSGCLPAVVEDAALDRAGGRGLHDPVPALRALVVAERPAEQPAVEALGPGQVIGADLEPADPVGHRGHSPVSFRTAASRVAGVADQAPTRPRQHYVGVSGPASVSWVIRSLGQLRSPGSSGRSGTVSSVATSERMRSRRNARNAPRSRHQASMYQCSRPPT